MCVYSRIKGYRSVDPARSYVIILNNNNILYRYCLYDSQKTAAAVISFIHPPLEITLSHRHSVYLYILYY